MKWPGSLIPNSGLLRRNFQFVTFLDGYEREPQGSGGECGAIPPKLACPKWHVLTQEPLSK